MPETFPDLAKTHDTDGKKWDERHIDTPPISSSSTVSSDEYAAVTYALLVFAMEDKVRERADEQKFQVLSKEWKSKTKFLSNIKTKSMHLAYQKIIGMGERAIPFILKDLAENGPVDWFWALHVITDADPVTEDISGHMGAVVEAWLKWGLKAGYLKDSTLKTKRISPT